MGTAGTLSSCVCSLMLPSLHQVVHPPDPDESDPQMEVGQSYKTENSGEKDSAYIKEQRVVSFLATARLVEQKLED